MVGPVIIYCHGTVVPWPLRDTHPHTGMEDKRNRKWKTISECACIQFYGRNFKLVGERFIKSLTYFHFQIHKRGLQQLAVRPRLAKCLIAPGAEY